MAPLLGSALLYFFGSHGPHDVAPIKEIGLQKNPAISLQRDSQEDEILRRRKELENRVKESMARTAKLMTSERIRRWTDTLIKTREARYHALFESWQLESAKPEEVLKIVRERETLKYEALQVLNENGADGRRLFGETLSLGKELADVQLSLLLGEARFQEFSRLEVQMESEMQTEGMKQLRND